LTVTFLPGLLTAKDIKIPDVSGMDLDDAISELQLSGLLVDKQIEISDDLVAEGEVIKTDPEIGSTVKENAKVTLYVSTGKEKMELSDYEGRLYDDVFRLLEGKEFKDILKTEKYDESEPGTIIRQNPSGGEEIIPEDTVLEFEVSKGPEEIVLRDLTAYNLKGAEDYASLVGLSLEVSDEKYDEKIPADMVISQTPKPGTEMKKGEKVSVVISKGKEEKPPKTVIKEITIDYEPTVPVPVPGEPVHKQEVLIYIEDMYHSMTEPAEKFFITETTKKQIELTIPFGGKAGYKIIRDTKVIAEDVINYSETE
jgi:eukaryotic-like serine/threonine-protein kinase